MASEENGDPLPKEVESETSVNVQKESDTPSLVDVSEEAPDETVSNDPNGTTDEGGHKEEESDKTEAVPTRQDTGEEQPETNITSENEAESERKDNSEPEAAPETTTSASEDTVQDEATQSENDNDPQSVSERNDSLNNEGVSGHVVDGDSAGDGVPASSQDSGQDNVDTAQEAVAQDGVPLSSHEPSQENVHTPADALAEDTEPASTQESGQDTVDARAEAFVEDIDDEIEDITSRAAIALAAVAVAATAQHSSPAAAAQAARALAPGIIPGAGMSPRRNQDMRVVSLDAVKHCLRAKASNDIVLQKLADGENDALLQHLLLLEYFRIDEDDTKPDIPDSPSAVAHKQSEMEREEKEDHKPELPGVFDQELAALAADRVRSMLGMIGGAYDSMSAMLPSVPKPETEDSDCEFDGIESPPIVPDLLPPCTSTPGDATAEFFRECSGRCEIEEHDAVDDGAQSATQAEGIEQSTNAAEGSASTDTGHHTAASVFSSVISSVKRSSIRHSPRASLTGVFRKRARRHVAADKNDRDARKDSRDHDLNDGEYAVLIEREMLGLTVENVLERTVVRTVLPGGAAKNAGAQVGSLIVKVGNVSTKNLTHFETIDELRQSQRPLRLVMRQISSDSLALAREEMGRLIRGAGYGTITGQGSDQQALQATNNGLRTTNRSAPIEMYSRVIHERWTSDDDSASNTSEAPVDQAGEKLVWILTLVVFGLEIEAANIPPPNEQDSVSESPLEKQRHHYHDAKDYTDASRSISKVLVDFMKKKVCPETFENEESLPASAPMNSLSFNRRPRRAPPPPGPPAPRVGVQALNQNKPLLQIGDVLHRTYTFLADPTSPPAALLRGEVVSFLCDVLDVDTGMELSEEENASSTAGDKAGPISDLGSAGSLLKLIVLNCSMMRSPGCGMMASHSDERAEDLLKEQKRRFGLKKQFSNVDEHRLHAGNRFLAVVHRLAASRSLSARVTACSLGPVLWGHLDFPHQLQLRGVITRALHDVDVVVRKSTATVLHEIAELVFDPRAVPWLVLMCERAMTDPEPQLRSAAMTLTWHLAEHLPNAFLGDASQGSRSIRRLPPRTDPTFAEVYLLQCKLLPVATRLAEDRAPSVRLAVAAQCDRLCNALGDHWGSVIIDVLQALLGDADDRVRSEAILCVPRLVETVLVSSSRDRPSDGGVGVLQALLPVSIKLQKDTSATVRSALATAAGELLTLLVGLESLEEIPTPNSSGELSSVASEEHGRERRYKTYVDETLIPLVQQLLHDSDPEVTSSALRAVTNASRGTVREMRSRRNSAEIVEDDTMSLSSFHSHHSHTSIEKREPVFIPVLSEAQVLRLLPTLTDLANNRQWRVRQGAVEIVPALLGCTNKLETRSEIARLCVHLMSDHVDAVRRTAAECLCLGGGGLGSHGEDSGREWISAIVVPHVRACAASEQSKQRQLSLKMVEVMLLNGMYPPPRSTSPFVGGEADAAVVKSPVRALLEVALSLSADRVANVRLNVGRVIGNVIHVLDDTELSFVISALKEQVEEEGKHGGDRDVLFFAKLAIGRAQARLEGVSSCHTPDSTFRI